MMSKKEVDAFLKEKNHPMTAEIQRIREIILETDEKIGEAIKWKSPTFMYKGNIASFFLNAKKFVSLMFHKGAFIPGDHDILEGDGKEARVARFHGMDDIELKKDALQGIIRSWIHIQDGK